MSLLGLILKYPIGFTVLYHLFHLVPGMFHLFPYFFLDPSIIQECVVQSPCVLVGSWAYSGVDTELYCTLV